MDEVEELTGMTISRPPSAFNQKALNRRSVLRKPSFLEIDDDDEDYEDDDGIDPDTITLADMAERRTLVSEPVEMEMESSFLDLDRGNSFDTVRSYGTAAVSFHAF